MMLLNKIDFKNIYTLIPEWKWQEIKYGLDNSLITYQDAINYANERLLYDSKHFNEILELAISTECEAEKLLQQLVLGETIQDNNYIVSKWIFAIIYETYNYSSSKLIKIIDDIYTEFDYPDEISFLISYMPSEDCRTFDEKIVSYIENGKKNYC